MHARIIATVAGLALASVTHAATAPTDPQIAAIVVTANQVDIDAGKLAQQKGSTAEVKNFGQRMVTDHEAVNAEAKALVGKLKVTPEPNDTSASLKKGGDDNLAALRKLDGTAFDRAYVAHEVAYHEQVIQAIEKTLIPNAKNAELKALLVKVKPAFDSHLAHAQQLAKSLGSP